MQKMVQVKLLKLIAIQKIDENVPKNDSNAVKCKEMIWIGDNEVKCTSNIIETYSNEEKLQVILPKREKNSKM